jgi:hypothetical protein
LQELVHEYSLDWLHSRLWLSRCVLANLGGNDQHTTVTMSSFITFFRRLYSLETLDTRFVTSSNTPPSANKDGAASKAPEKAKAQSEGGPSRWFTPEFIFYYVIFVIVFPLMIKAPIDASQRKWKVWYIRVR